MQKIQSQKCIHTCVYTTVTQALPMVAMFVYGSKWNEQSL